MAHDQQTVGDFVTLQRGTTYKGALVGKPGPALLGLGSIEPGGGFRNDYQPYGGDCPSNLMCFPGDLYAALKGATKDGKMIGSVARVPVSVPSGRLTQDTVKLVFQKQDKDIANFLYWVLRTPQYRAYCAGHAMGSAVVALSRVDFLNYPVPALTPARHKLIQILDGLEQKIEINRCMTDTLEATARSIFKAWFVDFETTKIRKDQDYAGTMSSPQNWKKGDVYEIADVIYGAPFKSALFNEDGIGKPLIRIRDLSTHAPEIYTDEDLPRAYLVQPGDLIVGMDGEFRAHLWRGSEAWLNQRLCCFKPLAGVPRAFVHYSIESLLRFFEHSKCGTTVIHLGKTDIDTFRIMIPPKDVLNKFGAIVDPIESRILNAALQSRTMTRLRDALLSKLITEDIQVREAEQLARSLA